eukprot:UN04021
MKRGFPRSSSMKSIINSRAWLSISKSLCNLLEMVSRVVLAFVIITSLCAIYWRCFPCCVKETIELNVNSLT